VRRTELVNRERFLAGTVALNLIHVHLPSNEVHSDRLQKNAEIEGK
jgi:hypothetical protein